MTTVHDLVAQTCRGLADLLAGTDDAWDAASLCAGWRVRHVVAHMTMPVRLTPELYGAGMAAAGGDFTVMSDAVAERDSALPTEELLVQLRSEQLHAWEPPGGGATGALNHAVVHSLDVTVALGRPTVAPPEAVTTVLDQITRARVSTFGVDLTNVRLEADDSDWAWGGGEVWRGDGGSLVALLAGRTLPDGRVLPRG